MSDLIDKQAAIDAIDKIFPNDPMRNEYTQGITCGAALAEEYIKQLPVAEPERKPGEWNWVGFNIESSECGFMPNFDSTEPLYRFCPNCGAYMRERRSE